MSNSLKEKLFAACSTEIRVRIEGIQKRMNAAQEAANNETKSTAGDKHDTSRAMMHQEQENMSKQLNEAHKLQSALATIQQTATQDEVIPGSLVKTPSGTYLLAIGLGKVSLENNDYFVISPAAPIGMAMRGKKVGDSFAFMGRDFLIEALS